MCWNYTVSATFAGLYLLINSYYWLRKPKFWKEYLMFGMFYFIMEVFQTMQWLFGRVNENSIMGTSVCDTINSNFTILAHILIWLQPVLFSYIGHSGNTDKRFFRWYRYLMWMIFIYSLVLLLDGFNYQNYYQINDSIFGLSTCTNKGATGHLVWRFKPSNIEYFPNYFMYMVMCIISFIMYDHREIQMIGLGWAVALVITKLILRPVLVEVASSWCLLSIIANVIIYVYLQF